MFFFQKQLSEERKDFIGEKIKRDSNEDKVKDLIRWMKEVYDKENIEVGPCRLCG